MYAIFPCTHLCPIVRSFVVQSIASGVQQQPGRPGNHYRQIENDVYLDLATNGGMHTVGKSQQNQVFPRFGCFANHQTVEMDAGAHCTEF